MAGRKKKEAVQQSLDALSENIRRYSEKDYKKLRRYLLRVVEGKEHETRVTNKGEVVTVPVPHQVRVQAAKALKELQFDKTVADKKDTQQHDVKFNIVDAIEEVAKRKQAEAEERLEKEGTLKKIGHGKSNQ